MHAYAPQSGQHVMTRRTHAPQRRPSPHSRRWCPGARSIYDIARQESPGVHSWVHPAVVSDSRCSTTFDTVGECAIDQARTSAPQRHPSPQRRRWCAAHPPASRALSMPPVAASASIAASFSRLSISRCLSSLLACPGCLSTCSSRWWDPMACPRGVGEEASRRVNRGGIVQ